MNCRHEDEAKELRAELKRLHIHLERSEADRGRLRARVNRLQLRLDASAYMNDPEYKGVHRRSEVLVRADEASRIVELHHNHGE